MVGGIHVWVSYYSIYRCTLDCLGFNWCSSDYGCAVDDSAADCALPGDSRHALQPPGGTAPGVRTSYSSDQPEQIVERRKKSDKTNPIASASHKLLPKPPNCSFKLSNSS